MQSLKRLAPLLTVAALVLAGVALAHAQAGGNFNLAWWTIDGGGLTVSSGGSFTMMGTVGQPEPGPALTSGNLTLYSGFWPAGGSAPPACPNPITGGWIVGPGSGYTGVNYDFTVGHDAAATPPLTYIWSSDGLVSGQGTTNATFQWGVVGMHTLSVTIENCGGSVNVAHSITLSAPPPTCSVPLTGVGLTGPSTGQANQDLTFTASYAPANATVPVNYTWSSNGLVSGQGANTAVYRWANAGQYQVTVSAANCGGSANASHSVAITSAANHYIYLPVVLRNY